MAVDSGKSPQVPTKKWQQSLMAGSSTKDGFPLPVQIIVLEEGQIQYSQEEYDFKLSKSGLSKEFPNGDQTGPATPKTNPPGLPGAMATSSAAAGWGAPVPKSSMQPGTPVATVLGVNSKPWEGTKWTEEEWKKWQQSKQERSKHIDSPTDAELEAAAKAVEAGLQTQQPVSPFSKAPPNSPGAGAAKIQAQGYEVTRQRQSPPRGAPYPTSGPQ